MIKFVYSLIIIICLLFFSNKHNKNEYFNTIEIKKDLYIPNKSQILDLQNKKINANRLCIYDYKDNNKKNDIIMECIDVNDLLSVLGMDKYRKEVVCLDGICLNEEDIKYMNGATEFKLKNKSTNTHYKNKCLGEQMINARSCGSTNHKNNIPSILPYSCGSSKNISLVVGDNEDSNLVNLTNKKDKIKTEPVKESDIPPPHPK